MAYDFMEGKTYEIDYKKLRDGLFSSPNIFDDKSYFEQYFSSWIYLIKSEEKKCMDAMKYDIDYQKHLKKITEYQMYQMPYDIADTTVYLHFQSGRLIENLLENKQYGQDLEVTDFTDKDCNVTWDREIDVSGYNNDVEVPILALRLPQGNAEYRLIDGNHKLKRAVQLNKKIIKGYFLNEKTIFMGEYMATKMEELFYMMLLEYPALSNLRKQTNKSDEEILKMSYLIQGEYMF